MTTAPTYMTPQPLGHPIFITTPQQPHQQHQQTKSSEWWDTMILEQPRVAATGGPLFLKLNYDDPDLFNYPLQHVVTPPQQPFVAPQPRDNHLSHHQQQATTTATQQPERVAETNRHERRNSRDNTTTNSYSPYPNHHHNKHNHHQSTKHTQRESDKVNKSRRGEKQVTRAESQSADWIWNTECDSLLVIDDTRKKKKRKYDNMTFLLKINKF